MLLGLSPELLHRLLQEAHTSSIASFKGKEREQSHFLLDGTEISTEVDSSKLPRIMYELNTDSNEIQPRLRMWTYGNTENPPNSISESVSSSSSFPSSLDDVPQGGPSSAPEYAPFFMYITTSMIMIVILATLELRDFMKLSFL